MNLIEQQNILRGLADDALKNEMGGNVPPYLVLAEVNRRKSARERYEAANAKYRANQPTVAEELMGQMPQAGIDTALTGGMRNPGPMAMPAGIDAAMPQPQPQAFADGGVVGYADGGIADLVSAYNARLSSTDEDRKNAQKMALMNIGAQIMAGRSRNTLSNVGSGLSAALPSYQQSMERLNTQEMQGLRDQIDLARQMEQDRLAQANSERGAKLDELRIGAAEEEAKYANLPAGAQDVMLRNLLKEQNPELYQSLVDSELAASNAELDNDNLRLSSGFNSINKTVERRYVSSDGTPTEAVPSTIRDLLDSADPTEIAAGRAQLQQLIKREAINEFRVNYPDHWSFADKVEENWDKVGIGGASTGVGGEAIVDWDAYR